MISHRTVAGQISVVIVTATLTSIALSMWRISQIMHEDHEMWRATIERYDSEFDKTKPNQ